MLAPRCESAIEVSWHAHTLFFAQVSVFVVQCLSQKASPQCSSATRPPAYICFRNGKCDTVSALAHNVNPYLHKPSCAETPRLHMLAISSMECWAPLSIGNWIAAAQLTDRAPERHVPRNLDCTCMAAISTNLHPLLVLVQTTLCRRA